MSSSSVAAQAAALLLLGMSPVASAGDGRDASCPDVERVWLAARTLMGHAHRSSAAPPRPQLETEDVGDRFRIRAAGREREFSDPARDCSERERMAAVFVAMTLVPGAPDDAPAAEAPSRPFLSAPPPEPRRWLRLEPSLLAAAGLGSDTRGTPWAWAGAVRISATGRKLGFSAGADVAAPIHLRLSGGSVTELRGAVDASLRLIARGRATTWWLDAGPFGVVVSLSAARRQTSFELGLRAAGAVAFGHGRVAPFAGVFAEVTPFTHDIELEPLGAVGRTAPLWIGLTLGLAADVVKPW